MYVPELIGDSATVKCAGLVVSILLDVILSHNTVY